MKQTHRSISRETRSSQQPNLRVQITPVYVHNPRSGSAGVTATLIGNRIYCFGGRSNEDFGAVLSLDSLAWRKIEVPVTVSATKFHTAVLVDDKIYIYGGHQEGYPNGTAMTVFDTVLESFTRVEFSSGWHREKTAATAVFTEWNRRIVFFGGMQYFITDPRLNCLSVFKLDSASWSVATTKGDLPSPRSGHSAVLDMFNMYVFGGFAGGNHNLNDLWVADLRNETTVSWSMVKVIGDAPYSRITHSLNKFGAFLVVLGGANGRQLTVADIELFHLRKREWAKVGSQSIQLSGEIPQFRSYAAVNTADGVVFLTTGGVYKVTMGP